MVAFADRLQAMQLRPGVARERAFRRPRPRLSPAPGGSLAVVVYADAKRWSAMSQLAGGTRPVAVPLRLRPQPLPPAPQQQPQQPGALWEDSERGDADAAGARGPETGVEAASTPPAAAPLAGAGPGAEPDSAAGEGVEVGSPARPPWPWRRPEPTVSARASAALARDRAATRTIVRLEYADGGFYEGEMAGGLEEGKGKRVWANGSWYAGSWSAGLRHGWGVAVTGGERWEGFWERGMPLPESGG